MKFFLIKILAFIYMRLANRDMPETFERKLFRELIYSLIRYIKTTKF